MLDLALGQRAFTVALNLAMALSVGSNLTLVWAARDKSAWMAGELRRLRLATIVAVFIAIAASMALLWMEAAAMAEVDLLAAGQSVAMLVADTQYGHAWLCGMVFLVLGAGAALLPSRRQNGTSSAMAGLLCTLVFFYTRSMTSHAAGDGALTLAVFADWVHLSLISLWVGEVLVAGFFVLPKHPRVEGENRQSCGAYLQALSSSATISITGIMLTGIANSVHNLSSVGELSGNPYGNALLLKLALVLVAASLGGANRFFVMPSLLVQLHGSSSNLPALRRFVLILKIESLVLVLALIVAAVLSATSPPMMS
ncbi:copper resistance D family protein [Undibacterium sp.]|uniref:copper resistance D family protein n=1 Tax=Undibacterium sp. TaxID=1914977 RepID=UPI00374D91BE